MRSLFPTSTSKVVTLPGAYFFVRTVPVAPDATDDSVAEQVDLALEALSPFPLNQVFYGFWWTAGSPQALVYAAYRRRFTSEKVDEWSDAELVVPEFAALLAWPASRAETLLLTTDTSVIALHWAAPGAHPTDVSVRALPEGADDAVKQQLREELVGALGGSVTVTVTEVTSVPAFLGQTGAREFTVDQAGTTLSYSREALDRLDIRDKEEMVARRQSRKRDLLLWRILQGCGVALLACLLAHVALWGGGMWEKHREERIAHRAPEVAAINKANELATRIEELATKRLLPFEMLDIVKAKKPGSVVFKSVSTQAINTLEVTGTTNVAADLPNYRSTLNSNPAIEKAEFLDQNARDGVSSFRLQVTFRVDAVKKAAP